MRKWSAFSLRTRPRCVSPQTSISEGSGFWSVFAGVAGVTVVVMDPPRCAGMYDDSMPHGRRARHPGGSARWPRGAETRGVGRLTNLAIRRRSWSVTRGTSCREVPMIRRRPSHVRHTAGALIVAALANGHANIAAAQVPRVQRVVEIGCEDCGDARQLASTWDVAVTEAGDVLVVDRDAPTLRMFDKLGRPLWSRGRPGAGPGEYRYAMRAAVAPDGSVQVVDMRLRRLTRLARDG